ncbi:MAG: hypothetical protein ACI4I4_02380 [Acutalibacteraceae bacterium]
MKRLRENSFLFSVGGISYGLIELLWRRYTHWTMIITGGLCFLMLYRIFTKAKRLSLIKKCLIGSGVITVTEFIAGVIVNLLFKMKVWDYSNMPFNLLGQICPLYSLLWALLCIPIVFICKRLQGVVKKI